MKIGIASGKGGTGKTLVSTSLASVAAGNGAVQFIDCDVEEPNAHIFLKPNIETKTPVNLPFPRIDFDKCTYCGICQKTCEFNAIAVLPNNVLIFDELCHACGACKLACPEKAIFEVDKSIGLIERGKTRAGNIDFVHGILDIGEMTSTPVIRHEKKLVRDDADVFLDIAPGTSCPVVTAVKGIDYVILVGEQTPFGLNDLQLTVELLKDMDIPMGAIINRYGTGFKDMEAFLEKESIPVLVKIPFRREIAAAYSRGELLVEAFPEYKQKFAEVIEQVKMMLNEVAK